MQTPAELYQGDLAFGAACRAVGWLPVVRAPLGSGESLTLTRPDGLPLPAIVLAGAHGAIEGQQWLDAALEPPDVATRTQLWREALGDPNLAELLASSAVLFRGGIERVARAARGLAGEGTVTAADVAEARRRLAPDALRMLAQPVPRRVRRDALVLPEALERDLHLLIARCRQRETIWQGIGPSLAAGATRGVRAFFAGESGTGKTLAASYVATALGAPLFRCDLGAVMNKYIGESEKNLGQLLDHAEAADVVLLFDEADALFGRRSDGAETGERYANMLTNFLLTRIENHNGIVILTANNKARIDPAFWRRLDVVMDFPLPGYEERLRLWESHLGARAPDEHVLHHLASYCDLAGGSIRNAVLSAAATVPPGVPIGSVALAAALAREYPQARPPAAARPRAGPGARRRWMSSPQRMSSRMHALLCPGDTSTRTGSIRSHAATAIPASRAKHAAGRWSERARHLPRQPGQRSSRRRVRFRHRFQQCHRVGMHRPAIDRLGGRHLHDAAEIHHHDAVAHVLNHRQVVRDEQHRQTQASAADPAAGSAPAPAPTHRAPRPVRRPPRIPARPPARGRCRSAGAVRRRIRADSAPSRPPAARRGRATRPPARDDRAWCRCHG